MDTSCLWISLLRRRQGGVEVEYPMMMERWCMRPVCIKYFLYPLLYVLRYVLVGVDEGHPKI